MDIVARSTATAELTSVLEKRVQARGECAPDGKKSKVSAEDDKWFPVTRNEPDLEAQARKACSGCPVRVECAELALREEAELPPDWIQGIYGGLAPHQRIAANKARRARSGDVAR
ncbi:WhiB family transcriptional regulator [Salinispora mooreana]|uniref:WhiB family transcriptional regulator n=1 Tax=Salinispora mooreana TaxID=999545 RepID=UPI000361F229|nr:WhiB family transcriptional regulator [Salinispora mooreana]